MKLIIYYILFCFNFLFTIAIEAINNAKGPISTNGKCGPNNNNTVCPGNECCNKEGNCGFDIDNFCGESCQFGYGYCLPSNFRTMSCSQCIECVDCDKNPSIALRCSFACIKKESSPKISNEISTDGTCGPRNNNKICPNNECCNKDGICGFTINDYCGDGCQLNYGYCLQKNASINCPSCKTCVVCKYNPKLALLCPESCKEAQYNSNKIENISNQTQNNLNPNTMENTYNETQNNSYSNKMENTTSGSKYTININNILLYILIIYTIINIY